MDLTLALLLYKIDDDCWLSTWCYFTPDFAAYLEWTGWLSEDELSDDDA